MIKFFREFRQQMITEKRFTKYLLYALGEIVLVVIGILIALQINNANEEHKKNEKRHELLTAMTKDLAQDIASHERMIGFYEYRLGFFERQLQTTDFSNIPTDTLFSIFDSNSGTHSVSDQSYQKAKNLGIAQLSADDSLSLRINQYYIEVKEINELLFNYEFKLTEKQNDFWILEQENLEFEFKSSVEIPIMQDSLERRNNALALITSPIGRNYIKIECHFKKIMLGHNKRMRQQAQSLLDDIEAYLNSNSISDE